MTWSLETTEIELGPKPLVDRAVEAMEEYPQTGGGAGESRVAIQAAKRALKSLLMSSALGTEGSTVWANATGHSNPKYTTAEGWPRDFITINVHRA